MKNLMVCAFQKIKPTQQLQIKKTNISIFNLLTKINIALIN